MKRVKTKIIIGLLTLVAALGLSNAASAADGNYYTVEINNGMDLLCEMSMQDLFVLESIDQNIYNGMIIKYGDQIIARIDETTGKTIVDEDLTVDVPMDQQLASRLNSNMDNHLSPDDYDGMRIVAKKEPRQQSSDGSHHVINLYDKPFTSDMSLLDMVILAAFTGTYNAQGGLDGNTFVSHENLTECQNHSAACTSDGKPVLTEIKYGDGKEGIAIPDGVTTDDNIHDVLTEDAKAVIVSAITSTIPWPSSYLNNLNSVTINFVEPPHEEQNNEAPAAETVSVPLPATFDDVLAYVTTFAGSVSALAILVLVRKKKTSKI